MQNFDLFINKNDLLKIDLINYILETESRAYEMRHLEKTFSISDYLLRETIDSLNLDLLNQLKFEWLFIDKGLVYQKCRIARYHLYKISQYYFALSPLKILLDKRLFTGSFPSYTAMQSEYGWSTSYFFAQKNKLTQAINAADNFPYIAFGYASYVYFDSVPEFNRFIRYTSQDLFDFLLSNKFIDENRSKQKQLLIALCVSEFINNRQDFLNTVSTKPSLLVDTDLALPEKILLNIGASDGRFLTILVKILDTFSFLDKTPYCWFSVDSNTEICAIQNIILPKVSSFFDHMNDEEIQTLTYELAVYSQQFNCKSHWGFLLEGQVSITYFRDVFPSIVSLSEELIQEMNQAGYVINHDFQNLYIFNIISIMYQKIIASQIDIVKINVSFSANRLTNDMIISMLKTHINHAGVFFIKDVTNADIYLSDTINEDISGKQVIWKKPPTISDWKALGELIIKIKQHEK